MVEVKLDYNLLDANVIEPTEEKVSRNITEDYNLLDATIEPDEQNNNTLVSDSDEESEEKEKAETSTATKQKKTKKVGAGKKSLKNKAASDDDLSPPPPRQDGIGNGEERESMVGFDWKTFSAKKKLNKNFAGVTKSTTAATRRGRSPERRGAAERGRSVSAGPVLEDDGHHNTDDNEAGGGVQNTKKKKKGKKARRQQQRERSVSAGPRMEARSPKRQAGEKSNEDPEDKQPKRGRSVSAGPTLNRDGQQQDDNADNEDTTKKKEPVGKAKKKKKKKQPADKSPLAPKTKKASNQPPSKAAPDLTKKVLSPGAAAWVGSGKKVKVVIKSRRSSARRSSARNRRASMLPPKPGESLRVVPIGSLKFPFNMLYHLEGQIGLGSNSVVCKAHRVSNPLQIYAVKVVNLISQSDNEQFTQEVSILKDFQEEVHVTKVIDFYGDDKKLYIVQELAAGSNLFDRLVNKTEYTENDARDLVYRILKCINAVHSRGVVHRDIKPANFLFRQKTDSSPMVLCDFREAKRLPEGEDNKLLTRCGTPPYTAPEVVDGIGHREQADMWSLGCIVYLLIGGHLPFKGENDAETYDLISKGNYTFDVPAFDDVNREAKKLISRLLTKDPKQRWTVSRALKCDWFAEAGNAELSTTLRRIQKHSGCRKLKAAVKMAARFSTIAGFQHPTYDWEETNTGKSAGAPMPGESLETDPIGSLVFPFNEIYHLDEQIAAGSFSVVCKAHHLSNPEKIYAVKVAARRGRSYDEAFIDETSILKDLRDLTCVTKVVDFFSDDKQLYMVQELAEGGDLLDHFSQKENYTEVDARDLAKRILLSVKALHERRVVHRNMKPSNLLLKDNSENSTILFCGFEWATHLPDDDEQGLWTHCGTPEFTAPEIVNGDEYREEVDMWSVGCILYVFISGHKPFKGETDYDTYQLILNGDYGFEDPCFTNISDEAKDLISKLLTVDPKQRWTATQALGSDWFSDSKKKIEPADLKKSLVAIHKYSGINKLKAAVQIAKLSTMLHPMQSWETTNIKRMIPVPGDSLKADPLGSLSFPFNELYELDEQIATGDFSVVCEAHLVSNPNEIFAVKVVNRTSRSYDEAFIEETLLLKELLDLKTVTSVVDFYQDEEKMFMVQEMAAGGDLFERLGQKKNYRESDVRDLAKKILEFVEGLHSRGVVHRDIKPEHILFKENSDDSPILVCDFDDAKRLPDGEAGLTTHCGTPAYTAPELVEGMEYREEVDMWSVGCILYMIISGHLPFMGEDDRETYELITCGEYSFDRQAFQDVSEEAKHLISKLLTMNQKLRWTAKEALSSDWFTASGDADLTTSITAIQKRSGCRKLRAAVKVAIHCNKFGVQHPMQTWGTVNNTIFTNTSRVKWNAAPKVGAGNGTDVGSSTNHVVAKKPEKRATGLKYSPVWVLKVPFDTAYNLGKEINSGASSVIYQTNRLSNKDEIFAVKVVNQISQSDDEAFIREARILRDLRDIPDLTNFVDFYMDDKKMYMVQGLATGGSLLSHLCQKNSYLESDARDLAKTLLEVVQRLHTARVVHRNLEPEHILLKKQNDDSIFWVCDFGCAKRLPEGQGGLSTRCGTSAFTAPEIVNGVQYREEVDMWSVGCILFQILSGCLPFDGVDETDTKKKIVAGEYTFDLNYWNSVSHEAKKVISNLLNIDGQERWSASRVLESKWMTISAAKLRFNALNKSLDGIRKYCAVNKVRLATMAYETLSQGVSGSKSGAVSRSTSESASNEVLEENTPNNKQDAPSASVAEQSISTSSDHSTSSPSRAKRGIFKRVRQSIKVAFHKPAGTTENGAASLQAKPNDAPKQKNTRTGKWMKNRKSNPTIPEETGGR